MRKAQSPLVGSLKVSFLATVTVLCLFLPWKSLLADGLPMRFDQLSLEDGLSQSAVLTILQDSMGFM